MIGWGCRVCVEKDKRLTDLQAANEWLREQLARTQDHTARIERAAQGLPELAPQKKKQAEPMPKEVRDLIEQWSTDTVREDLERRAYRLIARGKTWDDVKGVLEQYAEGEE